jgi:hypothetical protein
MDEGGAGLSSVLVWPWLGARGGAVVVTVVAGGLRRQPPQQSKAKQSTAQHSTPGIEDRGPWLCFPFFFLSFFPFRFVTLSKQKNAGCRRMCCSCRRRRRLAVFLFIKPPPTAPPTPPTPRVPARVCAKGPGAVHRHPQRPLTTPITHHVHTTPPTKLVPAPPPPVSFVH